VVSGAVRCCWPMKRSSRAPGFFGSIPQSGVTLDALVDAVHRVRFLFLPDQQFLSWAASAIYPKRRLVASACGFDGIDETPDFTKLRTEDALLAFQSLAISAHLPP